jgi:hypothetical protein
MDTPTTKNSSARSPYLVSLIIAVVVGAAGFAGGMMFQKNNDSLKNVSPQNLQAKLKSLGLNNGGLGGANGNRNVSGRFPGGFAGGRVGAGFVTGQIISADSQSITVKQQDGSTKVVYFSGSTTIDKTVTGVATDLLVGQEVTTNGTANSDGSIAAQTIQLRPAGTVPPVGQ